VRIEERTSRRPRGRPRKEGADDAIMQATRDCILEHGYDGMSIDEVAMRAGVGRQAVYRRWPSKAALVVASMTSNDPVDMFPDTGSFEGDVRHGVETIRGLYQTTPPEIVAGVYFAMASDPEAREIFNRNYIEPRRDSLARAIERGIARGDVRPDADVALVGDMVAGPFLYRRLVRGHDLRDELVDTVVGAAVELFGAGTRGRRARSSRAR
jgi:AcrR family transcriptional regulator